MNTPVLNRTTNLNSAQPYLADEPHYPVTPAQWFAERFPSLTAIYGEAVLEETNKDGEISVRDINEDFLAATFSGEAVPDRPTIFAPEENRFYQYNPVTGVYEVVREAGLIAQLSNMLLECARSCPSCRTSALKFRLRDAAHLGGVLRKARGSLEVSADFFASDLTRYIICGNGVLRLADRAILPFSPGYCRRNKLDVAYDPQATCPLFTDTLLREALAEADIDLLQRWCGLALIGENIAQKIMLLVGTAGGGKGTFIRVLIGIIGQANFASLRTNLLGERFELSRFVARTTLYGPDVSDTFLSHRYASVLKALTGGDPVTVEFKGSNESPSMICRFNVIATCNSRLKVHLEGDNAAWRRRLAVIEYNNPKPHNVIANLDERILKEEAAGVLNWMLDGLDKLRADGWQLHLNSEQQARVDNLLLESEGQAVFARECLQRQESHSITVADCFEAYVEFCTARGWSALTRNRFSSVIADEIVRQFGLTIRHDVLDGNGKAQRGWQGLALIENFPQATQKKVSETSGNMPHSRVSDTSDTIPSVSSEKNANEEREY